MPGKNINKQYVAASFYHVYNRGVDKQVVFLDSTDFGYFVRLLDRYLGTLVEKNAHGNHYQHYGKRLELVAYCMMSNHFHLLVYQEDKDAMREFMKSLTVSYSMYFNKKYKRVGPVFQQRYRAVLIDDDSQLQHITRYIHLNPYDYMDYEWSSYGPYINGKRYSWLKPQRILDIFDSPAEYESFVMAYKDKHDELELLKHELQLAHE